MELFVGVIVGLVILVILVVLHELGHAIVAHRNGVVVEEFGIGFPPRAWSKKLKNKVVFSLNWLPIGGFVKLKGEYDSANKKGDYGAASFWQKTKILLAGVTINWLTAAVLITILAWTGLPQFLPGQFSMPGDARIITHPVRVLVQKDSPADKAGLKTNDQLLTFAGQPIIEATDLADRTKQHKGQTVEITYKRDKKEVTVPVTIRSEVTEGQGYLGVATRSEVSTLHATWSAPIVGVVTTAQLTGATFDGLGKLLGNVGKGIAAQFSTDTSFRKAGNEGLESAKEGVFGPVGIFGTLFPSATSAGPTKLILLTAIISLSLAIMNVLPIPALDGGRWFTMAIFRLLKKPLTKEREEKIQAAGFLTLMALIVLVTVIDVSKIIR